MKTIKATHFYEYVKCPRKVYLNFHGDHDQKLPKSEFMQKKSEQGKEFEHKLVKDMEFESPDECLSQEKAFQKTLEYMKKGHKTIYQGFLIDDNLVGIPDLLKRTKGRSELGNYHYEAYDAKLSKYAKEEYIMQIMFYSYLLFKTQGVMPKKAYLLLGNKETADIDIKEYYEKFTDIHENIKQIAAGINTPIVINGLCKECVWKQQCLEKAEKENNISLIYNLSKAKLEKLKENNIKDLKHASEMDIKELSEKTEINIEELKRYKLQAQSLLTKKSIKLKLHKFPKEKPIFFDIEDTEDKIGNKIVYLFGLVIDDKFKYFLAKDPKQEKQLWLGFLKYFEDINDFKLYVYSHHEKSILTKLYTRYGGNEITFNKIIDNIIDLFPITKQTSILPIYSYTIKDVAQFLGFSWTSANASGSQSIIWYDKWLKEKNKKYLQEVLRYNEEDCRAMIRIKDWIERG